VAEFIPGASATRLPQNAKGITYYVGYNDNGPSGSGCYYDKYRKVGGKWYISERKTRLNYLPPDPVWKAGRAIIAADREAEARGAKW
jgi:hypothetical protein